MSTHALDAQLERRVEVDVCDPCQACWFDGHESSQLTPGATLALFRVMGQHVAKPRLQDAEVTRCPRCRAQLRRTRDMQRATRFEYFSCPNRHGRLITFLDFLKEKDFVRPLTQQQLATLRLLVQTMNCSNCGGPVDLGHASACPHCASPLTMLDLGHAEALVAQLQAADRRGGEPPDPALPLALARARREAEAAFKGLPDSELWLREGTSFGLVGAGLSALARWLARQH